MARELVCRDMDRVVAPRKNQSRRSFAGPDGAAKACRARLKPCAKGAGESGYKPSKQRFSYTRRKQKTWWTIESARWWLITST